MGCGNSKEDTDSSRVDSYLQDEKVKSLTNFKVLLLGAGESGKSTVVKQLKSIHRIQMDDQEILNYKLTLHSNTLTTIQVFVEAAQKFGYEFEEDNKPLIEKVLAAASDADLKFYPPAIGEAIYKLSSSNAIKQAFEKRHQFWNLDASEYYLENSVRFSDPDFQLTEEDCIMARVRTTGIVTTDFDDGPIHFSVVDVAGQRSERKKWIHCFDDVRALVFVVSLAGYNQVLFEDANHNRMKEALTLFQQICNNPLFAECPIFLFLNKKDLFEKMIATAPLNATFPNYTGGADIKEALAFVQNEFDTRVENDNKKRLHTYVVAARFKKDIKYAWDEIRAILVAANKDAIKEAQKAKKSKN